MEEESPLRQTSADGFYFSVKWISHHSLSPAMKHIRQWRMWTVYHRTDDRRMNKEWSVFLRNEGWERDRKLEEKSGMFTTAHYQYSIYWKLSVLLYNRANCLTLHSIPDVKRNHQRNSNAFMVLMGILLVLMETLVVSVGTIKSSWNKTQNTLNQ